MEINNTSYIAYQQQSNQGIRVSKDSSIKKRRKAKYKVVNRSECKRNVEWLPLSWEIQARIRKSGDTAGQLDYYFYDPLSKKLCRSTKEAKRFIGINQVEVNEAENDGDVIDLEGAHPPLMLMQDLNELPPEAEWQANEPVYPQVDGNLQ
ncbi:hypothetical protein AQUCO_01300668v1 [Aquilegia coerulea]|uniref:MBD domain-containing protein n=1 Tax=Aquilegia coerulea TaxID=218851 RepID=A0A2G5E2T3_AQUCA|nr:hypothetical protein AQUCO_01300668v1 [Aquilegia coerulea]